MSNYDNWTDEQTEALRSTLEEIREYRPYPDAEDFVGGTNVDEDNQS